MAAAAGAGYLQGKGGAGGLAASYNDSEIMDRESSLDLQMLFLGTGAADWPFNDYPLDIRTLLSGEYRGSSSLLINGEILVDCGPTVPDAVEAFSVDLSRLKHILITHTHRDHYYLEAIERLIGMAGDKLDLCMEEGAVEKAEDLKGSCNIRKMKVGKEFHLGKYYVLPLPANHRVSKSSERPLNFLFNLAGKHILYALDGAWLETSVWKAVQNLQLEVLIWDGTIGDIPGDYRVFAHNSLPMIRLMNQTLKANGVVKDSTRIILSHMARNLHPSHRKLQEKLANEGMEAAYDGMRVEIRP